MPGLFHSSKNQPNEAATSSGPKPQPRRRAQATTPTARRDQPAISSAAARDGGSPAKETAGSRRAIPSESTPNEIPARKRAPMPTVRTLIGQSLRAQP